jgi:hypothetical protein
MKNLKSYSCDICNKNYSSYQSLWIHNKKFHSIDVNTSVNTKEIKYCNICNKNYASRTSLWNHNKKFHSINVNTNINTNVNTSVNTKEIKCNNCSKIFKSRQAKSLHIKKYCKVIKDSEVKVESTKIILSNNINNQLINLIVDKTNIIEELQLKINNNENINLTEATKIPTTLNLNNVIIVSRSEDNYINATQLCQAGNKEFNDWYLLDSTKQLINEITIETKIIVSQLVEINNEFNQDIWLHPDLAIQLAQWISIKFGLHVIRWIRTFFINGTISNDAKLLDDKNREIRLKDHKIQLLQDAFVKKQHRKHYTDKNVIYMLTTEDNKKKRIYIIGKATNFKNRLSCYNKTSEHEVVYYKSCCKDMLNTIESVILIKLNEYQEKANRDRFILPSEKDITFFTNIIENCINFFN